MYEKNTSINTNTVSESASKSDFNVPEIKVPYCTLKGLFKQGKLKAIGYFFLNIAGRINRKYAKTRKKN